MRRLNTKPVSETTVEDTEDYAFALAIALESDLEKQLLECDWRGPFLTDLNVANYTNNTLTKPKQYFVIDDNIFVNEKVITSNKRKGGHVTHII